MRRGSRHTTETIAKMSGPAHHQWKGDAIGYNRAHKRLGRAGLFICVDCGMPAQHWSLKAEVPADRLRSEVVETDRPMTQVRFFSLAPIDYEARCARCHLICDPQTSQGRNARKTRCEAGHPFDEKNTHFVPGGKRRCRTCHRETVKRAYHHG